MEAAVLPSSERSSEEGHPEDWSRAPTIELSQLPPLPRRGDGFYAEPWCGIILVSVLCGVLVSAVQGVTSGEHVGRACRFWSLFLIYLWAGIAMLCCAYIILGGAGVVQRSPATCLPVPPEVAGPLSAGQLPSGLHNISDPDGSRRSYCVRCYVWRSGSETHHCSTCQRCVTGFDHHCGVFGRCIVRANMVCFHALIFMLFAGFGTLIVALYWANPSKSAGETVFEVVFNMTMV